jgi:hypothetical protein
MNIYKTIFILSLSITGFGLNICSGQNYQYLDSNWIIKSDSLLVKFNQTNSTVVPYTTNINYTLINSIDYFKPYPYFQYISDSIGLKYWTDARSVFNKNNEQATDLNGNNFIFCRDMDYRGVTVLLPFPEDAPNKFYAVVNQNNYTDSISGLDYSGIFVHTILDSLGQLYVIESDTMYYKTWVPTTAFMNPPDGLCRDIIAIRKDVPEAFWVIARMHDGEHFLRLSLDANSIGPMDTLFVPGALDDSLHYAQTYTNYWAGSMEQQYGGRQQMVACQAGNFFLSFTDLSGYTVYSFDRSTGSIAVEASQIITYSIEDNFVYDMEISRNGKYLYLTLRDSIHYLPYDKQGAFNTLQIEWSSTNAWQNRDTIWTDTVGIDSLEWEYLVFNADSGIVDICLGPDNQLYLKPAIGYVDFNDFEYYGSLDSSGTHYGRYWIIPDPDLPWPSSGLDTSSIFMGYNAPFPLPRSIYLGWIPPVITSDDSGTESSNSFKITLFPNPAQTQATLTWAGMQEGTFVLRDMLGRAVLSEQLNTPSGTTRLDLYKLPKGIYLWQVQSAAYSKNGKLVVE